jgi:riboflavin kinase/FMN adenylyltransferase
MPVRVFRTAEEARGTFGPCALSIGNFDGVHRGHQALFAEVRRIASEHNWNPSVLTFDPHPTSVVAPARAPRLLSTIEQRCRVMSRSGIEQVLVLPFNPQVAALSPEDFVQSILVDCAGARAVVVGDNFRFGHKQAGDFRLLSALGKTHGFQVRAIPAISLRGTAVSSSEIRRLILAGDVSRAARLLGRFYALEGTVVSGHGIGSRQTVPTLNLDTAAEVLPATGVYVTRASDLDQDGRWWPSITNVGYRPTFNGDSLTVETHLLAPLDGEAPPRLRVAFTHRLRDERRFDSPEALRAQILRDVSRAQAWHRRCTRCRLDIINS